jgi:hypothetical protein
MAVKAIPVVIVSGAPATIFAGATTPRTMVSAGPDVLPGPATPIQIVTGRPMLAGPATPMMVVARPVLPGKATPVA